MASQRDILCGQCLFSIQVNESIKCNNCYSSYHLFPCCPLKQSAFAKMDEESKSNWRCPKCNQRSKSPNTLYQSVIYNDINQQKKNKREG